ncbi:hypothetical protein BDQ17DRAFT_1328693 [Cyathus striatus]|nr:hypothetical protein BDQ17DRAFT_1328693 [Cyathus striatus]
MPHFPRQIPTRDARGKKAIEISVEDKDAKYVKRSVGAFLCAKWRWDYAGGRKGNNGAHHTFHLWETHGEDTWRSDTYLLYRLLRDSGCDCIRRSHRGQHGPVKLQRIRGGYSERIFDARESEHLVGGFGVALGDSKEVYQLRVN